MGDAEPISRQGGGGVFPGSPPHPIGEADSGPSHVGQPNAPRRGEVRQAAGE